MPPKNLSAPCTNMGKTDSQTSKATWWSVTAFNDEILRMEDVEHYPPFIKKVYGGREKCPETGTEHFQGCIQCHSQVRLSAFKEWLPTAHLEVARQKDALIKYAMKADTATGDKLERANPARHYSADEICELIAYNVLDCHTDPTYHEDDDGIKKLYNHALNLMLTDDPKLAGQLMNPSLRNFWCSTYMVWVRHALARREMEREAMEGGPDGTGESPE